MAQYRAANGRAATPPDELMLMTVPDRRARMSGSTAFVIRMTPKKLTWNSRIASSGVTSSAAPMIPVPALLCSTSIRPPVRSATALTQAATDSSEVTSSCSSSNPLPALPAGSRLVPNTR